MPGVGTLHFTPKAASFDIGEKQIYPPLPCIFFNPDQNIPDDFIKYVSNKTNTTTEEALALIETYCKKLNGLDAYAELEIPSAGKFYVDAEGCLMFKQRNFPAEFLPVVKAERIIHPEATHAILVGDKESNSALMTEFYTETEVPAKSRWWIWAIIFALTGAIVLIIYFNNETSTKSFGNAGTNVSTDAPKTYELRD